MRKKHYIIICLLLIVQSISNAQTPDLSTYHMYEPQRILFPGTDDTSSQLGYGAHTLHSTIAGCNFQGYNIIGWVDEQVDKSAPHGTNYTKGYINISNIGHANHENLNDTVLSKPIVFKNSVLGNFAYSDIAPTLVDIGNYLIVISKELTDTSTLGTVAEDNYKGKLVCRVISNPQTLEVVSSAEIYGADVRFRYINACKYNNSQFILFFCEGGNLEIKSIIFNVNPDGTLSEARSVKFLNEESNNPVGSVYLDSNKVILGWQGKEYDGLNGHINTIIIQNDIKKNKVENSNCSGRGGVSMCKADSTDEIHIIWRGLDANDIWQGVFTEYSRDFSQMQIPTIKGNEYISSPICPLLLPSSSTHADLFYWNDNNSSSSLTSRKDLYNADMRAFSYRSWMTTLINDQHKIRELVIPGSHNSGMNIINSNNYNEPNFFDKLKQDYTGDVKETCNPCNSQMQMSDISAQLNQGIRYFDFRLLLNRDLGHDTFVAYNQCLTPPNNPFTGINIEDGKAKIDYFDFVDKLIDGTESFNTYSWLAYCKGQPFDEMLRQAIDFIKENSSEVVIINISDIAFKNPENKLIRDGFDINYLIDVIDLLDPDSFYIYRADESEKSFSDILDKTVGDFRGQIIITVSESTEGFLYVQPVHKASELVERQHLLYDIFENKRKSGYRHYDYSLTIPELKDQQKNFIEENKNTYKRLDWTMFLALQKIACDLDNLSTCVNQPKNASWINKVKFYFECQAEQLVTGIRIGKDVLSGDVADGINTVYGALGSIVSIFTDFSPLATIEKANSELPDEISNWKNEGVISKDNFVNIIYADNVHSWMTDVCIQLNKYYKGEDIVNRYNNVMKVVESIKPADCENGSKGSIHIEARGGRPPYTYECLNHPEVSMPIANNLDKGKYTVRIKDSWNHTIVKDFFVPYNISSYEIVIFEAFDTNNFEKGDYHYFDNYANEDGCAVFAKIESKKNDSALIGTVYGHAIPHSADSFDNIIYASRVYQFVKDTNDYKNDCRITLYYSQQELAHANVHFKKIKSTDTFPTDSLHMQSMGHNMILVRVNEDSIKRDPLLSQYSYRDTIFPKDLTVKWKDNNKIEVSFYNKGKFGAYYLTTVDPSKNPKDDEINLQAYLLNGLPMLVYTGKERNIKKYVVQYSTDGGKSFKTIKQHNAIKNSVNTYNHYHQDSVNADSKIIRYRVIGLTNGKHVYSNIAWVDFEKQNQLLIYPNPFTNNIIIMSKVEEQVQFIDIHGRVLINQKLKLGENTFDTYGLSPGMYIIRLANGETHKVVKKQM